MISAAPAYIKSFVCALAADSLNECGTHAFDAAKVLTVIGDTERALELLEHAHTDLSVARVYTRMLFHIMGECGFEFVIEHQEGCTCT